MFKKSMIAIMLLTLLISAGMVMFADVEETVEEVIIINPVVGNSGKAIIDDSLFISIYIESEDDLVLELVKKPVFNFEETVSIVPYANNTIEEKVSMFDMIANEVTSKQGILEMYQSAVLQRDNAKVALSVAKSDVTDLNPDDDTFLTEEEQLNMERFNQASSTYNAAVMNFSFWQKAYLKLFDQVIIDNMMMYVDPAFSYFEYTVDNITPGHYVMRVKNSSGYTVESLSFEVVTQESIADEILDAPVLFDSIREEVFE